MIDTADKAAQEHRRTLRQRAGSSLGRRCAYSAAALALAVWPQMLRCQQTPPPEQQPPGAGAQVHTGTASGLDTAMRLDNLLADHAYRRVEAQLDELPPRQAQLYRGILANRDNDAKKSIVLLEPLVDEVAASGNREQEKLLRMALAEDYLREGDWTRATAAYHALDERLSGKLTPDEQDEIEMPLKLLPLAAHNPPMTADACDPFQMQANRNPLGLLDVPVFVDARPHSWLLDPTAPFNLIARSLAREAGLTVSQDAATIHTLTGRPVQVRMTVIPRFTIGGILTLRNMTAFVFDDEDYAFPHADYHVQGVLGFPALQALGSITVTDNQMIFVDPSKQAAAKADPPAGTRFFLDGGQVIAALGVAEESGDGPTPQPGDTEERMFVIDTTGQQTYLTSRYYAEHSDEFEGRKLELYTLPGQTVFPSVPAYAAETVSLATGTTAFDLHDLHVLTQPLGSAARDDVYGLLGVDALDQLRSYRFDYRTMRFSVNDRR